eukprot:m.72948 g.72948  ORF g.72948 m.72948 type:complete len:492 (+) comp18763_c0_seq1:140-1615(+)
MVPAVGMWLRMWLRLVCVCARVRGTGPQASLVSAMSAGGVAVVGDPRLCQASSERSTTTTVTSSGENLATARRTTASAAASAAASGVAALAPSAASSATSTIAWSSMTSVTPSVMSTTSSSLPSYGWNVQSGTSVTSPRPPSVPPNLSERSPNARETASMHGDFSEQTRGTPPIVSTSPPAASMRSRSEGSDGLWSVVRRDTSDRRRSASGGVASPASPAAVALAAAAAAAPGLRPMIARLSPVLAQMNAARPNVATHAVDPQSIPASRIWSSVVRNALTSASMACCTLPSASPTGPTPGVSVSVKHVIQGAICCDSGEATRCVCSTNDAISAASIPPCPSYTATNFGCGSSGGVVEEEPGSGATVNRSSDPAPGALPFRRVAACVAFPQARIENPSAALSLFAGRCAMIVGWWMIWQDKTVLWSDVGGATGVRSTIVSGIGVTRTLTRSLAEWGCRGMRSRCEEEPLPDWAVYRWGVFQPWLLGCFQIGV